MDGTTHFAKTYGGSNFPEPISPYELKIPDPTIVKTLCESIGKDIFLEHAKAFITNAIEEILQS